VVLIVHIKEERYAALAESFKEIGIAIAVIHKHDGIGICCKFLDTIITDSNYIALHAKRSHCLGRIERTAAH
jgi:hypothetical protein